MCCCCCCCCVSVCQSILHPLDESAPVYSCYVIPNTAQGKNLSYLFCSLQQTNSTAVHRTDFSRNTNWPPYLHKATFNNKGEKFFTPDIDKKALFRASKWYQRSKVCRWTFLYYILVTQTISLPLTFSYILSTNCAVHSHITLSYWRYVIVTALRNGRSGVRIPGRAIDISFHNSQTDNENRNGYRNWFPGAQRPRWSKQLTNIYRRD